MADELYLEDNIKEALCDVVTEMRIERFYYPVYRGNVYKNLGIEQLVEVHLPDEEEVYEFWITRDDAGNISFYDKMFPKDCDTAVQYAFDHQDMADLDQLLWDADVGEEFNLQVKSNYPASEDIGDYVTYCYKLVSTYVTADEEPIQGEGD